MEKQTSSPLIAKLSVELKQMILSNVADVLSLRSAALSCRALYNALLSAETIITTRVLLNQVDIDVLPEANIAQEALRLEPCTEERIQSFIARHLHKRQAPPEAWRLRDAVPIAKLHACVSELAFQFLASAAMKSPACGTMRATRAEISRIERAMYRFEIFCNLFRGFEDANSRRLKQLWSAFFLSFSPWENEQLACVHDYLVQTVYPAFKDIAEHDVAWGEFKVDYGDHRDSIFIQYLLSLGLQMLRRISMAETYEARYELLYSGYHPHFRYHFVYEALNCANGEDDDVYLSDFTSADEQTHIRPPFFDDPDTGPADVWRWAHQDQTCANFVNQDSQKTLRDWGYVMWDRVRLDESGILQSGWGPPDRNDEDLRAETQRHAEMVASWEARSSIYMRGGRGWWSFGDDSKIIWPNRKAPREGRSAPARTVPNSLEEAKDAFRLMTLPESVKGLKSRKRG